MGNDQSSARAPAPPVSAPDKDTPTAQVLVRGCPRMGKSSLISSLTGDPFPEAYEPTPSATRTAFPWSSPRSEPAVISLWDIPTDASAPSEADGLVLVIDGRSSDAVSHAGEAIRTAAPDLPILVFSNFLDAADASPLIPEGLQSFMGRFYFVPGSARLGQGLAEIARWFFVPLLAFKRKQHLALFKKLEAELIVENAALAETAAHFLEEGTARAHVPVAPASAPEAAPVSEEAPIPEAAPAPEAAPEPEEVTAQAPAEEAAAAPVEQPPVLPAVVEGSLYDALEAQPLPPVAEAKTAQQPRVRKPYEKPYRRRAQGAKAEEAGTAESPEAAKAVEKVEPPKPAEKPTPVEKVEPPKPAEKPQPVEKVEPPKPVEKPKPIEKVEPPPVEDRTERPLLETPIEMPIIATPLAAPPVAAAKAPKPEVEEGAFWSDGDDEDEAPPIKIELPEDDDDEEVLKPNPLVVARARKVDLTASIRLQAEAQKAPPEQEQEPPPMPPALDAEALAAVALPPEPAQATPEDGYGELPETPKRSEDAPEEKPAEKRVAKVRAARFRARGRGSGQPEADE